MVDVRSRFCDDFNRGDPYLVIIDDADTSRYIEQDTTHLEGNLDVGEWGQYAPIIAKMAYQSVISKATTALKMVGEPEDEIRIFDDKRLHWMFCKDNLLTCYYYVQSSACQSTIHGPMNSEQPFWVFYQKRNLKRL